MRVLLSGAIGAVVSAAVWLAAEHFSQANLGWLVCLIGLVTGFCVHRAGGAGAGSSFARGALAIVLTLIAIVGGRQVYAKIMQATSQATNAKVVMQIPVEEIKEETSSEEGDAPEEQPEPELELPIDLGPSGYENLAIKSSFSEIDMLWMCISALAAYVTGKGSGVALAGETTTEEYTETPQNGDPPPEDDK